MIKDEEQPSLSSSGSSWISSFLAEGDLPIIDLPPKGERNDIESATATTGGDAASVSRPLFRRIGSRVIAPGAKNASPGLLSKPSNYFMSIADASSSSSSSSASSSSASSSSASSHSSEGDDADDSASVAAYSTYSLPLQFNESRERVPLSDSSSSYLTTTSSRGEKSVSRSSGSLSVRSKQSLENPLEVPSSPAVVADDIMNDAAARMDPTTDVSVAVTAEPTASSGNSESSDIGFAAFVSLIKNGDLVAAFDAWSGNARSGQSVGSNDSGSSGNGTSNSRERLRSLFSTSFRDVWQYQYSPSQKKTREQDSPPTTEALQ